MYFNPGDIEFPIGLNVIGNVSPDDRHLVASGIVAAFKGIWRDSWGPRLEYILYNSVSALLECRNQTLLGVNRLLTDDNYRANPNAAIFICSLTSSKTFPRMPSLRFWRRLASIACVSRCHINTLTSFHFQSDKGNCGDPTPSEADIKVTHDLIRAGQLMKIEITDHVIMGNPIHSSLRELGYFYS